MGFSENGSKRAAVATNNAGAEQSMEWVLGHMEDPDFNDPLPGARLPATEDGGVTISAARSHVPLSVQLVQRRGRRQRRNLSLGQVRTWRRWKRCREWASRQCRPQQR